MVGGGKDLAARACSTTKQTKDQTKAKNDANRTSYAKHAAVATYPTADTVAYVDADAAVAAGSPASLEAIAVIAAAAAAAAVAAASCTAIGNSSSIASTSPATEPPASHDVGHDGPSTGHEPILHDDATNAIAAHGHASTECAASGSSKNASSSLVRGRIIG